MEKISVKKICVLFISVALAVSAVFSGTVPAKAAEDKYIGILHKVSSARPNFPIRYNFSLAESSDIYFDLKNNERTTVTLSIKNRADESSIITDTLSSADPRWKYHKDTGIYQYTHTMHLPSGEYILELNFEAEVNYELSVSRISPGPVLQTSKLTVTKGFSTQLKVAGGKIKSCSSSNKKIATATKSGKVTGKKTGKAKITVTLTNGKKLACTVTVKANKYTSKKLSISDVPYNSYGMKAYSASFDKKGNLVVKFTVGNNSYGKIESIPKFAITVKDTKGNTTVSYKKSSYSVTVKSYSVKNCTVTVPKSSLKKNMKSIDLRTSKITVSGDSANAAF